MGPMTGRAAGFCAGYNSPGFMNAGFGRGGGRGMGFGRGRGWFGAGAGWGANWGANWAPPAVAPTQTQQAEALKGQVTYLEETLATMRKQIEELETGADTKK